MKRAELVDLLNARVLCGENVSDLDIQSACGSDMMSDVLAFTKHDAILLTGLVNNHVLRTAEMLDIPAIMFVRGKVPSADMIRMAEEMGIVLMATEYPMFTSCGILYEAGLQGGMRE